MSHQPGGQLDTRSRSYVEVLHGLSCLNQRSRVRFCNTLSTVGRVGYSRAAARADLSSPSARLRWTLTSHWTGERRRLARTRHQGTSRCPPCPRAARGRDAAGRAAIFEIPSSFRAAA